MRDARFESEAETMTYPPELQRSLKLVDASRHLRAHQVVQRLTPQERLTLIKEYHPDHQPDTMCPIMAGANKGQLAPCEVVDLLHGEGWLAPLGFDLSNVHYSVDVLVVGTGGAGLAAALAARENGAEVLIATKLRLGDSNTVMATGIAAATAADDSPAIHYLDTVGGAGFTNVPDLVSTLVLDGPYIIAWLEDLGVMFDRLPDGNFRLGAVGGYSRSRTHSSKDFTGLEIVRVLRDEIVNKDIPVLEFSPAVELVLDERGQCAGAVHRSIDRDKFILIQAKTTILATGGMGRLHLQGWPTTNHYGATADGIVLAYRAGAKLADQDSVQYHPTGVVWPEPMYGQLVTERCRGSGAQLVNARGERFVYELETRDVVASAIIRECGERHCGIETRHGVFGVWLDTTIIKEPDRLKLKLLHQRFLKHGINIWQQPILVYPTQHYQNGGLLIDIWGRTTIPNLYAAGEVTGGIHGRNRLAGNSLLDVLVFGKRAGRHAALVSKEVVLGKLSLDHLNQYSDQLRAIGVESHMVSPILFPNYARSDGANDSHARRRLSDKRGPI